MAKKANKNMAQIKRCFICGHRMRNDFYCTNENCVRCIKANTAKAKGGD